MMILYTVYVVPTMSAGEGHLIATYAVAAHDGHAVGALQRVLLTLGALRLLTGYDIGQYHEEQDGDDHEGDEPDEGLAVFFGLLSLLVEECGVAHEVLV